MSSTDGTRQNCGGQGSGVGRFVGQVANLPDKARQVGNLPPTVCRTLGGNPKSAGELDASILIAECYIEWTCGRWRGRNRRAVGREIWLGDSSPRMEGRQK